MKRITIGIITWIALLATSASAEVADPERWGDYLDFAYVYSSAEPDALKERLASYGKESGISLEDYVTGFLTDEPDDLLEKLDETQLRRRAIANLLQYLASRDPDLIDRAAEVATVLKQESDAYESRYWYHYIHAHRAMERGNANEFVGQNLDLWVDVVVPLEAPFETLESLSLAQSTNTGFVSALPYVFENIARMILIRSQELGLKNNLDPLASIVRLLDNHRVGFHPSVIPQSASAAGYLERIVARLDGPESDSGSLSFTLALFEAGKFHDQARSLLAEQEFSEETLKAIGVASGAYQTALDQTKTLQGEAAVYVRVLRQIGEVAAAKQRLGVDPYVESPFDIEEAIEVYDKLFSAREGDDWQKVGFRRTGREAYLESMRGLWQEIQECSLNTADFYLTRSLAATENRDEYVHSAVQTYNRYLALFDRYVTEGTVDVVPNSAYFAAYEAAKGYGDAYLNFASRNATASEMEGVTHRYLQAMHAFPFDAQLWPALARALERLGRSGDYLSIARPIADQISRSRHLDAWINNKKPGSEQLTAMRRALSDDLVLMYLGFASVSGEEELDESLAELRRKRSEVAARLKWLKGEAVPLTAEDGQPGPAARSQLLSSSEERPINMTREIARTKIQLDKLTRKVDARARALPIYKKALESDSLIEDLRSRRNHPAHTLLRRMYRDTIS